MQITWLGHACFKVTLGDSSIVLDPFAPGSVPGLREVCETADAVLCSHQHHDHNYTQAVTLTGNRDLPFRVTTLSTYHDAEQGEKRGPNTIHVLEADGKKIVHLGDLGCALTPQQIAVLQGCDVLLIPVGGFYTIDAAQAKATAEQVGAKTVIPMHYRSDTFGYDVIAPLETFTHQFEAVSVLPTSTYVVSEDPTGVVVLTYTS